MWSEREKSLGIETVTYRPLEASGRHYRFGVELYNVIQRTWPRLHHLYWNFLEIANLLRRAWALVGVGHFAPFLQAENPDAIVSVHPHLNHGFFELARAVLGDRVRLVTYCGDMSDGYGFSRHWVNGASDGFLAATEACREAALRRGMPESRARVGGFMLEPAGHAPPFSEAERTRFLGDEFGLDAKVFTLLLATGGVGANNHTAFLRAMDRARLPCQVIALCGRHPAVLARVQAWTPRTRGLVVRCLPYTRRMPDILRSVSAVVTRGGAGTTGESIMASCPIITNCLGGSMPQECITMAFLKKHGLLRRVDRPGDLPAILAPWLENPADHREARERTRHCHPGGHPRQILEDLRHLVGRGVFPSDAGHSH